MIALIPPRSQTDRANMPHTKHKPRHGTPGMCKHVLGRSTMLFERQTFCAPLVEIHVPSRQDRPTCGVLRRSEQAGLFVPIREHVLGASTYDPYVQISVVSLFVALTSA